MPGQSVEDWRRTLDAALALEPDHLSVYALALDDPDAEGLTGPTGDHLPVRRGARAWRERARAEQSRRPGRRHGRGSPTSSPRRAGLRRYEIANLARPGHESRHNLLYWRRRPYLAIGPGAHASDGGLVRSWNAASLSGYLDALRPTDDRPPRLPPGGHERVDVATAEAERAILGLRLTEGIDAASGRAPGDRRRDGLGGRERARRAVGRPGPPHATGPGAVERGLHAAPAAGVAGAGRGGPGGERVRPLGFARLMSRRPLPVLAVLLIGLFLGVVPGTAAQSPDEADCRSREPRRRLDRVARRCARPVAVVHLGWRSSTAPTTAADPPPLPRCRYRDRPTRYDEVRHWRMTLLDTTLRLQREYEPSDLVSVRRAGIAGSGMVRKIVIEDLRALADAAREKGKALAVRSAHRSYAVQEATFASWVQRAGYEQALLFSARPGHSEHQLGTAIDFTTAPGVPLSTSFGASPAGKWLARNGWRYGFVMSYPKGKRRQSCYGYEPWHWRYVGRERAAEIEASGQVPRRYLWETFESVP